MSDHAGNDRIYHVKAHREAFGSDLASAISAVDSGWREGDESPGRLAYSELLTLAESLRAQLTAAIARAEAAEARVSALETYGQLRAQDIITLGNMAARTDAAEAALSTLRLQAEGMAVGLRRIEALDFHDKDQSRETSYARTAIYAAQKIAGQALSAFRASSTGGK